ncbi:MAG TPA: FliI/YscN family ATPase [Nevskiaceae bacterium]|nr:FliI/YscN family ATPase [Nevskiaceae bacterium]
MDKLLANTRNRLSDLPSAEYAGRVVRATGLVLEAVGIKTPIGSSCRIEVGPDTPDIEAEVVGFSSERTFLMPLDTVSTLKPGALVYPLPPWAGGVHHYPVGDALLGRVLDGNGRPLDDKHAPLGDDRAELDSDPINPMRRAPIKTQIDVGIRAINALFPIGRGQRMGLFAGSGVGKSVLLGMMAKYTSAERVVVGLVGERGREVKEFIDTILGPEGMQRAVVVAAPADTSPLQRLRSARYATRIAEAFRDEGRHVLLIMDSLTRFAMAQREIALAIGEPPATKGYPPSVFAQIPALVERSGNGEPGGGSITAFYTVLVDGDDLQDPVADSARAILDGHIVLSRAMADAGHYPAIDIEASISRAMPALTSAESLPKIQRIKLLFSTYNRNRDLMAVGAYAPGHDAVLDAAVAAHPAIEAFLCQSADLRVDIASANAALAALMEAHGAT